MAVEGGQQFARHFNLFPQFLQKIGGDVVGQFRVVQPLQLDRFRQPVAVGAVHQFQPVGQKVVGAHEIPALADGP